MDHRSARGFIHQGDPVERLDDGAVRSDAVLAQDAEPEELGLRRHAGEALHPPIPGAVHLTRDDAGHMGPVPVRVRGDAACQRARGAAFKAVSLRAHVLEAAEMRVILIDSGVEHCLGNALPGGPVAKLGGQRLGSRGRDVDQRPFLGIRPDEADAEIVRQGAKALDLRPGQVDGVVADAA